MAGLWAILIQQLASVLQGHGFAALQLGIMWLGGKPTVDLWLCELMELSGLWSGGWRTGFDFDHFSFLPVLYFVYTTYSSLAMIAVNRKNYYLQAFGCGIMLSV
jgi:hypothetical protein